MARSDFEKLERVRDLEATLEQAAMRAKALATDPWDQDRIDVIVRLIPPAHGPREQRVRQLAQCLTQVEALRARSQAKPNGLANASISGSRPAPEGSADASETALHPPLEAPVQYLKGVGPRLAELLAARDVRTVGDLLRFLPRRYEGRQGKRSVRELTPGLAATLEVEVLAKATKSTRGRPTLDVVVGDDTGILDLHWFHVPGGKRFAQRFSKGQRLVVSGQVRRFRGRLQMVHPETQMVTDKGSADGPADGIVPIYAEVEGIRPAHLRRIVANALPAADHMPDPLPDRLREKRELPSLPETIRSLHCPPCNEALLASLQEAQSVWHKRLIYEELFVLQLVVLRRRALAAREAGRAIQLAERLADLAGQLFDFELTGAQARVVGELEADMSRPLPMQRLLQGDVGCGKTAVAVAAAAGAAKGGLQTAIMAPTEILAEQHARTALQVLPAAGVRVALLTGSVTGGERRRILEELKAGEIQVIVGTHALIQDDVVFAALGLAIVDEQHRFGVMQRARLLEQGRESLGFHPHMLVMTATPIPRSLALTVYGDLDVSVIDELPPGRPPMSTHLFREKQRDQVYRRVRHAVAKGQQAYVVFPLVEESEKEGMETIRDATSSAEELREGHLQGLRLGLLHGRMSGDEKDAVMRRFTDQEIEVLVATTVIEVGIDVPNATVMVIEHAERFGLSQLHQLRGRVGRGFESSQCLLVARYTPSEDAWRRLKIMEQTRDGFRIAEEDLAMRGPGDFLGTRQSGLPLLSVANLARDQRILMAAREDATELLQRDPEVAADEHGGLREFLMSAWAERLELVKVG